MRSKKINFHCIHTSQPPILQMAAVTVKSTVIEFQMAPLIKSLAEKYLFWREKKEGKLSERKREKDR